MSTGYYNPEKLSQKPLDVKSRSLFEQNSELKQSIINALNILKSKNSDLPVVHITSSVIHTETGEKTPGFVENIEQKGFEPKNTNVGAFVIRGKETRLARPDDLIAHPGEFVKDLVLILKKVCSPWHKDQ